MTLQRLQKHVRRDEQDGTAWCGARIGDWHFQDAQHALLYVAQGGRLLPCAMCARAMLAVLESALKAEKGEG